MSDDQTMPPGWYPQGGEQRYWDGMQWTDQRAPFAPTRPQYTQPQKRGHALRNVLLVVAVLMVLAVGGCFAVVGLAANEVGKSIDESVASDSAPGGPDNPMTIEAGKAFEVDDFNYATGWRVQKDFAGDVAIKGLKVTNNRGDKDSALVEIKFWSGSEVLALSDCTTSPIDPGSTVTLSCGSGDTLPKNYDKITINDTF